MKSKPNTPGTKGSHLYWIDDTSPPVECFCSKGMHHCSEPEISLDNLKKADRFNEGKLLVNLIPAEWIIGLAEIMTQGAKKYAPNNWKLSIDTADHDSFKYDRLESAKRHILQYDLGEKLDSESGQAHLLHAAINLLMCAFYDQNSKEV